MSRRAAVLLVTLAWSLMGIGGSRAEPVSGSAGVAPGIDIPVFIDPSRRLERRERGRIAAIRFLTEEDFPPFHYLDQNGQLAGFNIDIAQAICAELAVTCTIQPRRWEGLLPALDALEGDAVIASHRVDAALRRAHGVSQILYRVPARFISRKDGEIGAISLADLAGKRVAVVGGSAHEAFLNALFPRVAILRHREIGEALEAVRRGGADLAFGDGVSLAFWLNGSESLGCCRFVGGAFTESRYFGEGTAIVMRKSETDLRDAIDYALWRISRDGRFARLYLKHFPIPFY